MNKKMIIMALGLLMLSGCASNNTATEETTSDTTVETTIVTTEVTTESSEKKTTTAKIAEETTLTEETTVTESSVEAELETKTEAEPENDTVIVDSCVLTKESVEATHPEIEGRTEEEVRDLLSVLTDEELKKLCPTDEDLDIFIQVARGREGNMFRDVTLDSIAKAAEDSSIYYNADCDIVFDYEGNEGVPVVVYYSKPKFLVYDWSLLVADAFGYDAEQIKAFCESEDYEAIKTADVATAREILTAHGGEPAEWL